ncbi:GntR family transcriptional regulator [Paracoccus sp. TK19116]|uniref:GntR family transcriptional regulator n=1 Tax=Paracoccus albicereus TaxID=2922394 RepID=A0ABT1MWQ8_9RHOB|nr:GntR family transcriptional regulator [Paracoccus albicereus]MCQ0971763.1 GntR family transcriptional regulator [Paracoccus albicereus]
MTPPRPTEIAAHERLYRTLRSRIMLGEIPPGRAMTLRGLAAEYHVSMTPARDAVRRLVAEGALSLSGSGRVSTTALSEERIEELAAMRALIEPELAARALPRAHHALIDRLSVMNGQIADAVERHDATGYIRCNLDFHRTLYLRAQAPLMLAMLETVWLQLGPTMHAVYLRLRGQQEPPRHHRMILSALRAGDEPALRLAVRADVTHGLRHIAQA